MESKPRVLVFLSTYNGEKYLREQLDSIFAQEDVDISVFATDDISRDSTVNILREYSKDHKLSFHVNKTNKNFTYNFLDNIYDYDGDSFDYYALADQDDVWLNNKIISAIKMLKETGKHFYCSNLTIVDEKLVGNKPMNKFKVKNDRHSPYILENICTGCTTVFDNAYYKQLKKYYPIDVYLHDYWLMLVAAFTSSFVYDTNSHILYRQHSNNQIGSSKNDLETYMKSYKNSKYHRHILCTELLNGFKEDISEEDLKDINTFLNYKKKLSCKMKLLFSPRFKLKVHPLLKKIKIIANKY